MSDSESEATDSDDSELEYAAHKVDGSSIGFEEMTLDILMVRSDTVLQ